MSYKREPSPICGCDDCKSYRAAPANAEEVERELLPDCMAGPNEPCKGYKQLYEKYRRAADLIASLRARERGYLSEVADYAEEVARLRKCKNV